MKPFSSRRKNGTGCYTPSRWHLWVGWLREERGTSGAFAPDVPPSSRFITTSLVISPGNTALRRSVAGRNLTLIITALFTLRHWSEWCCKFVLYYRYKGLQSLVYQQLIILQSSFVLPKQLFHLTFPLCIAGSILQQLTVVMIRCIWRMKSKPSAVNHFRFTRYNTADIMRMLRAI